jgi:hypothetical protein
MEGRDDAGEEYLFRGGAAAPEHQGRCEGTLTVDLPSLGATRLTLTVAWEDDAHVAEIHVSIPQPR